MAIPYQAIATLGSGILGALTGNDDARLDLEQQRLNEARRAREQQYNLLTSDRKDAHGNVTRFTEGRGFETILAPLIQEIVNAQNMERHKSLTQDAKRNRDSRNRRDDRSIRADELYNEKLTDYEYSPELNEDDFKAEAIREALLTYNKGEGDMGQVARQAIRSGNTSAIGQFQSANAGGPQALMKAIFDAKRAGSGRYHGEKQAKTASEFGEMNQLRNAANDTGEAPLRFGNDADKATAQSNSALQQLSSAMMQGSSGVQSALSSVGRASSSGGGTDWGNIFGSVAGLLEGMNGEDEKEISPLHQAMMENFNENGAGVLNNTLQNDSQWYLEQLLGAYGT